MLFVQDITANTIVNMIVTIVLTFIRFAKLLINLSIINPFLERLHVSSNHQFRLPARIWQRLFLLLIVLFLCNFYSFQVFHFDLFYLFPGHHLRLFSRPQHSFQLLLIYFLLFQYLHLSVS
ncbi:MAG: hypothetical protein [Podoviridae sp. ctbd591]|nr:MAG: hypothetical protein [Podoviridae sp. ctbd591]